MALDSAFAGKSVLQQEAADLMEIDSMSSDHDSIPDPYQGMSQADIDAAKAAVPYVPANRPGPTAGPKAVLADAAAHADDQRRERERAKLARAAMATRAAVGSKTADASVSYAAQQAAAAAAKRAAGEQRHSSDSERGDAVGATSSAPASDDEDDDAFFASYRAQRLTQLHSVATAQHGQAGPVEHFTTAEAFLDGTCAAATSKFVAVLLWEEFHAMAARVQREVWPLLAGSPQLAHVRFADMVSSVGLRNFEPSALPTVVIYRDGDTVQSILMAHAVAAGDPDATTCPPIADWIKLLQRFVGAPPRQAPAYL